MTSFPRSTRQPPREPWSIERLIRERAIALGTALDSSTHATYTSHLQSYLAFCDAHHFPIEPTPDTLSFFVVYMSHHIKPSSVESYLSGICSQLESYFPDVRAARKSPLVARTLAGCKKRLNTPTVRKSPMMDDDLRQIRIVVPPTSHDNRLFVTITFNGFHALHRLGELTQSDNPSRRSSRKLIRRSSVRVMPRSFSYILPGHKADRFFEGNNIVIEKRDDELDAHSPFCDYLASRDVRFPFHPALFLRENGTVPTRSWYIDRLSAIFPDRSFAGQSLRSGGATFLALCGFPETHIQTAGRWASSAWRIYVRKNPVVLHAMMQGRRILDNSASA